MFTVLSTLPVSVAFTDARAKVSDMLQRVLLGMSSILSFHNGHQVKPMVQPDFIEDFQNILVKV